MKANLASRSSSSWAVAAVTLILVAYPIARIVLPAVLHAVLPNAVQSVLNAI